MKLLEAFVHVLLALGEILQAVKNLLLLLLLGSLLLRRPGLLTRAVLLSPMIPFEPDPLPDLAGTSVFIGAGRADTMVPARQTEKLAELLRESGANVSIHWESGGHAITPGEVKEAQQWLAKTRG